MHGEALWNTASVLRTCLLAGPAVVLSFVGSAGHGGSSSAAASTTPIAPLASGPVTLVALGDSLTFGEGDETGLGFAGRLAESIAAEPGREGSTLVNLGQNGWDSTMLVDGQEGAEPQLALAVDEVRRSTEGGGVALATVLIGSNDLWYLYDYGPLEGTDATAEDAAIETYRTNLDRAVAELQEAGAVVVVGLPDDQTLRPGVADIDVLHMYLPNITAEEVDQMSALALRFDVVAEEVAAEHGALTVDTNDPLWADPSKMADDGIHPNVAGYADLAELWMRVIEPLL
jgi:lysophospholipase L1-like esterase